jgi:hypothetical protein
MTDELDQLKGWGASITPPAESVRHARAILDASIRQARLHRPSHRRRRLARTLVVAGAMLFVAAGGIAIAVRFSPEPALQAEGRRLVPGSLGLQRSVISGDLTWTAYRYVTDDGLRCLDFELSTAEGSAGSIGGCSTGPLSGDLDGTIGGVGIEGQYHQILAGRTSETIALVRATSGDGQTATDQPESGVWLIVPERPAATWRIEALDQEGVVQQSIVVTDVDLGSPS